MNLKPKVINYIHTMSTSDVQTDLELIRQIASKDQTALEELYQRYHLSLYNFFMRTTQDHASGEDLLQELFISVWEGAARFEARSSVKTWLFRIAHFMSAGWLRNHQKTHFEQSDPENLEAYVDPDSSSLENQVFLNWNYSQIHTAMNELSSVHREIIELTFLYELSQAEIAYILSCPVGTVKSRLHMALRQLNRILKAKGIQI